MEVSSVAKRRHYYHPQKPTFLLWTLLILYTLSLSTHLQPVDAVQTSFAHYFPYENSAQVTSPEYDNSDDVSNSTTTSHGPSPPPPTTTTRNISTTTTPTTRKPASIQPMRRENYGSLAAMIRWNTFTIVSDFGMETNGRVQIEITNLTFPFFPLHGAPSSKNAVPVVFTLYDLNQWRAYSVLMLRDMPLKSPTVLCHYPAAMRYTVTQRKFDSMANKTRAAAVTAVFDVKKPSLYTLQVQVCGDASVYVRGKVTMVNRGFDGKLSEHLAVEELGLVALYEALIVVYSFLALLWVLEGFLHRKNGSKLGHAFQVALHVKTLEAFLKLWYFRELSVLGNRDTTLKIIRDTSESVASAVLLLVMLLAALGWSLTRDELSPRERRLMVTSFCFYFLVALVKATCTSDQEDICKAYMLTEYLIKSIMMLGVIVALNFTSSQLRLALNEARWNNYVSPLMYMKLNQFQNFRYVFFAYLLIPTGLLLLNMVVITPPGYWRYDWVNAMLTEVTTLGIFAGVGLNLRPIDSYVYAHISRGTDTASPAGRNAPPSPTSPMGGNVVLPEPLVPPLPLRAEPQVPPRTASEETIEANRRLLREYSSTSTSPPPSPPPPPSRRAPLPSFSPLSLMHSPMSPMSRRL